MTYTITELEQQERHYRANLLNSITGLKPANLIGTMGASGVANVAIFSSVVHLGASPALIAYVQRPLTSTSHTYHNILATKQYTINHVHQGIVEQAHYTAAKYNEATSEYTVCNLTPEYVPNFTAPYVLESIIKIGLELVELVPIKHNNTTLVIGKVVQVMLPQEIINADGSLNLEAAQSMAVAGLDAYYTASHYAQYPYAQVGNVPKLWGM